MDAAKRTITKPGRAPATKPDNAPVTGPEKARATKPRKAPAKKPSSGAPARRPVDRERSRRRLSVSHGAMLVDGADETFRHTLHLMNLAADRLATFREAVGRVLGLTGSQYLVFLAAAHAQGREGATIRELASYVLMASTHVTTQVGALIRMGLLRKRPNREDGRSVLVSLTERGERALDRIAPIRREFNDAFFVGIDRETLLGIGAFMQRIVDNSDRALPLLARAQRAAAEGRATAKEGTA